LGASLGGGGGGSGGRGYGGSGYGGGLPDVVNTGIVSASGPVGNLAGVQAQPINHDTFFVIGANDPRAGRQLQQLLDNNARRG
jgi:hypothetical protein